MAYPLDVQPEPILTPPERPAGAFTQLWITLEGISPLPASAEEIVQFDYYISGDVTAELVQEEFGRRVLPNAREPLEAGCDVVRRSPFFGGPSSFASVDFYRATGPRSCDGDGVDVGGAWFALVTFYWVDSESFYWFTVDPERIMDDPPDSLEPEAPAEDPWRPPSVEPLELAEDFFARRDRGTLCIMWSRRTNPITITIEGPAPDVAAADWVAFSSAFSSAFNAVEV